MIEINITYFYMFKIQNQQNLSKKMLIKIIWLGDKKNIVI